MAYRTAAKYGGDFDGTNGADWLWGDDDDNVIHGLGGNDNIYGRYGNDSLYGDAGNDVIRGADHNDLIEGGAGSDVLTGGKHLDDFVFGASAARGADVIRDFSVADGEHEDQLVLLGDTRIVDVYAVNTDLDDLMDSTMVELSHGDDSSSSMLLLDVTGVTLANYDTLITDTNDPLVA